MVLMLSLAVVLLLAWAFLVWERERRGAFAREWVHVPLVGGVLALLMGLGMLLR